MKFVSIIIVILVVAMCSCKMHKDEFRTFAISISNTDTCIELSANDSVLFRRDFEILENTLSDTVGLSGVLYPGETGKRSYLKDGNNYFYIVTPEEVEDLPPIRTICFSAYLKRPVHGIIILRFKRYY